MLRRLAFLLFFSVSPIIAQQASITGTLTPYANGQVTEQGSGNSATINGQGFFRMPITSVPNHTLTLSPVSGSFFTVFSISVSVATNGNTDVSQQLLAAMPIPNPFVVASLLVQTTSINIAGLQYTWPTSHAVGCLTNNGTGALLWLSCGSSSGISSISVNTANGISGTSSGGNTPTLTLQLGDINPTSVTVNNTTQPTQWDYVPTSHATVVKTGTASIGTDTVNTGGVYLLPQAPASGFYYGTNNTGKVTHTYINGFSGTCGPSQTATVVNGLITGCS
jgi:hypothetical protein